LTSWGTVSFSRSQAHPFKVWAT